MIRITILIILLLTTSKIYSQDLSEKIVLVSKLNLRKEPSKNSKIVTTLPFNTQIEVLEIIDTCFIDITNNISSKWAKVKHNNHIGYVAEYYINEKIVITERQINPRYINYKNWYKIITTKNGDYLKKISVKLHTIKDEEDNMNMRYFIVEKNNIINEDNLSRLIGTNTFLKEGKISSNCSYFNEGKKTKENDTSTKRENLWVGKIDGKTQNNKITFNKDMRFINYSLEIIDNKLLLSNGTKSQNLTEFMSESSYFVEWYGDMDGDNKLDLIIYTFKHRYLLLSKNANTKQLINLASDMNVEEGC